MMSRRTLTATFEDGTTEPVELMPGAPGDKEYNFSFRGSGFSGYTRWSEAHAEAIKSVEAINRKKVRALSE